MAAGNFSEYGLFVPQRVNVAKTALSLVVPIFNYGSGTRRGRENSGVED